MSETSNDSSSIARDGQRDAVDGDRALLDDVAQQRPAGASTVTTRAKPSSRTSRDDAERRRRGPARRGRRGGRSARSGSSRFTRRAGLELAERRAAQRLVHDVGAEALAVAQADRGQADAVDRDRVALGRARRRAATRRSAARRRRSRSTRRRVPRSWTSPVNSRHHSRSRADTSRSSPTRSQSSVSARSGVGDALDARRPRAGRAPRGRRARSGARNRRTSSISPASRNAPARCGPPSSRIEVTSALAELVERGAHARRLVLAGRDDDLGARPSRARRCRARGAARETTTVSGISARRAHELASRAAGARSSRRRRGAAGGRRPRRAR